MDRFPYLPKNDKLDLTQIQQRDIARGDCVTIAGSFRCVPNTLRAIVYVVVSGQSVPANVKFDMATPKNGWNMIKNDQSFSVVTTEFALYVCKAFQDGIYQTFVNLSGAMTQMLEDMDFLYTIVSDEEVEAGDLEEVPRVLNSLQRKITFCTQSGLGMKEHIQKVRDFANEMLIASKTVEAAEATNALALDAENKETAVQLDLAKKDAESAAQDREDAKKFLAKMEDKIDKYRDSMPSSLERGLMRVAEAFVGQLGGVLSAAASRLPQAAAAAAGPVGVASLAAQALTESAATPPALSSTSGATSSNPDFTKAKDTIELLATLSNQFASVFRELKEADAEKSGKSQSIIDKLTELNSKFKYQSANNTNTVVRALYGKAVDVVAKYLLKAKGDTVSDADRSKILDNALAVQKEILSTKAGQEQIMFKIQNDAATAQIAGIHKAEIDVERQELERLSDRLQRAEQREVDALKTLRKFEATCREMEAKLKSLKSAQDSAARIKVVVAAVIKHLIDAQQEINKLVNSFIQIETSLKKIAENAQAFKDNSSAAIKSGKAPTKNQSRRINSQLMTCVCLMRNTAALAQIYNYMHIEYATPMLSIVVGATEKGSSDAILRELSKKADANNQFFDEIVPSLVTWLYGREIAEVVQAPFGSIGNAIQEGLIEPVPKRLPWQ